MMYKPRKLSVDEFDDFVRLLHRLDITREEMCYSEYFPDHWILGYAGPAPSGRIKDARKSV